MRPNIIMAYNYTIDERDIIIDEINDVGQYDIIWKSYVVGYIYVSKMDEETCEAKWIGSTPYLNLIAPELGSFIENFDV